MRPEIAHTYISFLFYYIHTLLYLSLDFRLPCAANISEHLNLRLTSRLHVAVRLYSNISQMTSKCSKNEKPAYEAMT